MMLNLRKNFVWLSLSHPDDDRSTLLWLEMKRGRGKEAVAGLQLKAMVAYALPVPPVPNLGPLQPLEAQQMHPNVPPPPPIRNARKNIARLTMPLKLCDPLW